MPSDGGLKSTLWHAASFVGLVLFVVVCGIVMHELERPQEMAQNAQNARILSQLDAVYSIVRGQNETLAKELKPMFDNVQQNYANSDVWDLPGSFLYWFTVMSTIGYGSYCPKTWAGKTFTCIGGLLGVCYFGFMLEYWTAALKQFFDWVTVRTTRCCAFNAPAGVLALLVAWTAILSGYVCFFAAIAWLHEGWGYGDCVYFSIVTFTTIGFGDFAPSAGNTKFLYILLIYIGLMLLPYYLSTSQTLLKTLIRPSSDAHADEVMAYGEDDGRETGEDKAEPLNQGQSLAA